METKLGWGKSEVEQVLGVALRPTKDGDYITDRSYTPTDATTLARAFRKRGFKSCITTWDGDRMVVYVWLKEEEKEGGYDR